MIVAQAWLVRWVESAAPALPSGAGAARDTADRHPAGQQGAGSREPEPVGAFSLALAYEREDVGGGGLAIRCARQEFTG